MTRYKRKPEYVEAVQYDGKNVEDVAKLFGEHSHKQHFPDKTGVGYLEMRGPKGYIFASPTDMVVKGGSGIVVNVKADAFRRDFELAEQEG